MKKILLTVALRLFMVFTSYAEDVNIEKKLLYPDNHIASLNVLLEKEFTKRVPKSTTIHVQTFPFLASAHRLTTSVECNISVPSIKTQDPHDALLSSLPYAQAYVDTINNIPLIRPYLIDFPISLLMWEFALGCARDEKTKLPLYSPYIASLLFLGYEFEITRFYKTITYPNGRVGHNSYDNIYDESKGLPEEFTQMAIPQFDKLEQKVPQRILETKKYCYYNQGMKLFYDFYQNFAQKHGLTFVAFEKVYDLDRPYERKIFMEVAYATQEKKLTLDEAKDFALKLRDEHAQFCVSEAKISHYINALRKNGRESPANPINIQKYISFRVSFWDEYIDRVQTPAIAEIRVYGTRARYYVADELQRLKLVCEEEFSPYERDILQK
jgi:hypothetical protein